MHGTDTSRRGGGQGDLEIIEERTMIAIPRGDREELRLTFTRARMSNGREAAWHGLRVFWKADDGSMRPGKAGVTIRGKELRAVTEALLKATGSTVGTPSAEPPTPRRAPEHRQTRANQPSLPEPPPGRFDDEEGIF